MSAQFGYWAIKSQMVGCIFWIDLDGLAVVLDGLGCYLKQVALDKEIAFLELEIMTLEPSAVHNSHFNTHLNTPTCWKLENWSMYEHVYIKFISNEYTKCHFSFPPWDTSSSPWLGYPSSSSSPHRWCCQSYPQAQHWTLWGTSYVCFSQTRFMTSPHLLHMYKNRWT